MRNGENAEHRTRNNNLEDGLFERAWLTRAKRERIPAPDFPLHVLERVRAMEDMSLYGAASDKELRAGLSAKDTPHRIVALFGTLAPMAFKTPGDARREAVMTGVLVIVLILAAIAAVLKLLTI